MEIKNSILNTVDPYRNKVDQKSGDAPDRARSSGGQSPAAAQGDRVSLSSSAILHTTAHTAANAAPDVRQEKVDSIKASLAQGTYAIDTKKVALKLLENEALLADALE